MVMVEIGSKDISAMLTKNIKMTMWKVSPFLHDTLNHPRGCSFALETENDGNMFSTFFLFIAGVFTACGSFVHM